MSRRPKYQAIDRAVTKEGWQVVVLLRLSPIIPFNVQNYALGVTSIPFWHYLGATLIGIIPGIAICCSVFPEFSGADWAKAQASSTGFCSASVSWRRSRLASS